jgi:LacI family transcriptional regulator
VCGGSNLHDKMPGMSLEQVANMAGVSTATVSRVLNGVAVVKSSTRSRVMKAVAELKYHPNLHARSLAGGRSRTIGVIVSNLDNPFFLDVYRAVEGDCHAHGYEVLVANTAYSSGQLAASIRLMIGRRVAGLAVIVSEMEDDIVQELSQSQIPIVFYDVGTGGGNITKIRVNYRKGIARIVEYLAALGHDQLAFVGHHSVLGPIDERRAALFDTVAMCARTPLCVLRPTTIALRAGDRPSGNCYPADRLPPPSSASTISWPWAC